MKKKFKVVTEEVWQQSYIVMAKSSGEAAHNYCNGTDGEAIEDSLIYTGNDRVISVKEIQSDDEQSTYKGIVDIGNFLQELEDDDNLTLKLANINQNETSINLYHNKMHIELGSLVFGIYCIEENPRTKSKATYMIFSLNIRDIEIITCKEMTGDDDGLIVTITTKDNLSICMHMIYE